MGDIIATLQAEQDKIIRAGAKDVLVVDGGPGTGKTAVALHRAAYLLFTDRDRLDRAGVLIVGPSPVFLRYIDQVLPSLGETGVVFSTPGRLFPGIDATGTDDVPTATLKGDARMAAVIAAAVRDRQELPPRTIEIVHEDDHRLRLDRGTVARARTRARRSRRPHNSARSVFVRELLGELTAQVVAQLSGGLWDEEERAQIAARLRGDPGVRAVLDRLWPRLTPQQLLTDLFTPDRLARAAGRTLTPAERALLLRDPGDLFAALGRETAHPGADVAWTPADVPLLDEAAELLGDPDEESRRAAEAEVEWERQAERHYASGVLEILGLTGQVDADMLADRWSGPRRRRSAAEHAESDRTWTFGHLIVDEAQEVSPMLWRLLWRRCPARSATLVGDLAQAAHPGAPASWADVLTPHVGDRWRVERLSVNYRAPQEIMDVAADVLAAQNPALTPPVSVRSVGRRPTVVRAGGSVPGAAVAAAVRAAGEPGDGRVAVICPETLVGDVREAFAVAAPELVTPERGPTAAAAADSVDVADALDARVAVLTVAESKGLEFDAVVLVEPAALLAAATRGLADLYVALTRATRMLTVVYSGDLPDVLARLAPETPRAQAGTISTR
jgi:DNA helicase IV